MPTTYKLTTTKPKEPRVDTGPADTRPYLCIPYWETPLFPGDAVDIGQIRPLPGGVISWECQGIHASPYLPGEELQVTVDVRNSGHGSATVVATVVVFWADPTVGFAKPMFFGATTVAAPTMRDPMAPGFVSATITGIIPAMAPNHICLLARVTHGLDQNTNIADPINDRHWAQHNIIALSAKVSSMIVPFTVANPFNSEELFELRVRSLDRDELERFALHKKLEPSKVRPKLLLAEGLDRASTARAGEAQTKQLALGPRGRRRYSLKLDLDQHLSPYEVSVLELALYRSKDQQRLVGSLGIVIRGDDSET